ncbi:hypothetical protein Hanom_Chr12g01071951 [Helianthus anomalus]
MPSSYSGRHMPLPRLEPGTSGKRWVSVANWANQVGFNPLNLYSNRYYKLVVRFIGCNIWSKICIKQKHIINFFLHLYRANSNNLTIFMHQESFS